MFHAPTRHLQGRIVDRAAVVGVDEAVFPQFGALVDVGDAGDGQRQQFLAQRVTVCMREQLGDQFGEPGGGRAVQNGVEPAVHGGLECLVGVNPR